MKLHYKPTDKNPLSSVYVKRIHQPYLGENWHFHEEFELIYFLKGSGMRIVGDHISNFQAGELVLVGQWLPHLWRNAEDGPETAGGADFIVVKFSRLLKGIDFFSLPELNAVRSMLAKAIRGIQYSSATGAAIHHLLTKLHGSKASERLILFLRVLEMLAADTEYVFLSTPGFTLPNEVSNENRLQKVISYIFTNYSREISLDEIADLACMTSPAFCRFFKGRTNKTFFGFLNEFRVNKACQLLIDGELPIKEVCYEVGFRSLTNFNRTFKKIKDVTPGNYRMTSARIRQQL
ncbi:AraC family transcriptional regulator [Neolewinella persica]|uniref:AraC family transcriptional regulator n=1 Tax=Neolewinella persica TaxID=70998 RepID=UPI00037BA4BA|nr:AraC family transcriptional regulator [Neolewinella persica]